MLRRQNVTLEKEKADGKKRGKVVHINRATAGLGVRTCPSLIKYRNNSHQWCVFMCAVWLPNAAAPPTGEVCAHLNIVFSRGTQKNASRGSFIITGGCNYDWFLLIYPDFSYIGC